jgi:hypothetical protein
MGTKGNNREALFETDLPQQTAVESPPEINRKFIPKRKKRGGCNGSSSGGGTGGGAGGGAGTGGASGSAYKEESPRPKRDFREKKQKPEREDD